MKRRLFNILSALSLLLCVAVVLLWVRSIWRQDWAIHDSNVHQEGLRYVAFEVSGWSNRSHLCIRWGDTVVSSPEPVPWQFATMTAMPDPTLAGRWDRFLVSYQCFVWAQTHFIYLLAIHYFWLAAMTLVLPASWLVRTRRRQQRLKQGQCLQCGYDLRASKERCPECGTAIPADSVAGCELKAI